jgi:hypothetical protein
MSPIEFDGEDIIIDGVPSRRLVASLKEAGLPDEAVTDLLGRMLASGSAVAPAAAAAAAQRFVFETQIAQTAPDCAVDYTRGFVHPDFFDGLTVVQAGQTPEELGFNFRFHAIEDEFDAVGDNLIRLSNCLAQLRLELFGIARELEAKITEIEARLTKDKEKEKEKEKEVKEIKEKEHKEGKDKEKEGKDTKDKEKDHKDGKEKEHKEALDKIQPAEKREELAPGRGPRGLAGAPPPAAGEAPAPPAGPVGQVFIRPQERPAVGEWALRSGSGG